MGFQQPSSSLGTLARGLRALEALSGRELTVTELAVVLDCHRQSAYRVMATLEAESWVVRIGGDRYALSSRAWSVGVRSLVGGDEVRRRVSAALRDLAAAYGETSSLAVYEGGQSVQFEYAQGAHALVAAMSPGRRAPAHAVASGKVYLAAATPAEREHVLRGPLSAFTALTITDPVVLAAQLRKVAEQGYAVNRGEHVSGIGGIAVPVFTPDGTIAAALSFSGPADRILPQTAALVAALQETSLRCGAAPVSPSGSHRPQH